MTAVEFLAERYNYITWMRNRDEISAGTADEWRAKFLKEAKEMEEKQIKHAVSNRYTLKDMIDAYDAGVWNPNDETAKEYMKRVYNVC